VTALLLLLAGYLVSVWLVPRCSRLERLGYSLLFALTATPVVAASLGYGLGVFVSKKLVAGVALAFVVLLAPHAWKRWQQRRGSSAAPGVAEAGPLAGSGRAEGRALLFAALVAAFYWSYYSNSEFLLSLLSYLLRGEAECFYMQTFSFAAALNPEMGAPQVEQAYNIISTPGNTLFTTSAMAIFGLHSFHVLYVLFAVVLFLFTWLLLAHWTESEAVALVGAAFICLNPYVLSVEVLDRNFIALALSAAAFCALAMQRDRIFMHGLLFGLCAAAGLRFLPLLFLVPVALIYLRQKVRWLQWLLFGLAFMLVVAHNLPHLSYHGFHSLGETESLPQLAWLVVSRFERSPFLPLPNLLFYPVHMLACLGSLCGGLVLLGGLRCWQQGRSRFLMLALVYVLPWAVLACQRDWLQGDKSRILIMSMLPIAVFLGYALHSLLRRTSLRADLISVAVAALLLQGLATLSGSLVRTEDTTSYFRHPLYQHDSAAWQEFYRPQFARVGPLPSIDRLFQKADLGRKHRADQQLKHRLFGPDGAPSLLANPWVQEHLPAAAQSAPEPFAAGEGWIDLDIDLEKLASDPEHAATLREAGDARLFADLRAESDTMERLAAFDVVLAAYHKEVEVSWQPQALPVTVLTSQAELAVLGEIYVDLNAWISLGKDELEFQQVNIISYAVQGDPKGHGRATAMAALPPRDSEAAISLRIPAGTTVILRNWLVDGTRGVPHRIDSWSIKTSSGQAVLAFHCLEPESYL
jgi:hypothetical protein